MSLFPTRTARPDDTDAGVDLSAKPTTYPPFDHSQLRQAAEQDAERDWARGGHDVPTILAGSLEEHLEGLHRQADRLRSESRHRALMATLTNRINRARILSGEDAGAPSPGCGLDELNLLAEEDQARVDRSREQVIRRRGILESRGIQVPPIASWWYALLLAVMIVVPPIVVGSLEQYVLTGVMSALSGTEDPWEAFAWAALPLLFLVLMPEAVGAYERHLDQTEVPESDPRRTACSRAMVLPYAASLAISGVRAAYALDGAMAPEAPPAAGAISTQATTGSSIWEIVGLVVGFFGIAVAFAGTVWLLRFLARHTSAKDQLGYLVAVRAENTDARRSARSAQQLAATQAHLTVNDADRETNDASYRLEQEDTIPAVMRDVAETYLLEFLNQAGSPQVTEAVRVWAEERLAADTPTHLGGVA